VRPAPAAKAARAASSAAPVMPGAPPMTARSPKLPLCCACAARRCGDDVGAGEPRLDGIARGVDAEVVETTPSRPGRGPRR
jgi:hypothetical protein